MLALSLIPIQSEKAYQLATDNVYTFRVPLTANKQQIVEAVQSQFGVTVTKIKTLSQRGKNVAYSRGKRSRPGMTKRSDTKKAYVTLAEGSSIKIYEEPKQEEKV